MSAVGAVLDQDSRKVVRLSSIQHDRHQSEALRKQGTSLDVTEEDLHAYYEHEGKEIYGGTLDDVRQCEKQLILMLQQQ